MQSLATFDYQSLATEHVEACNLCGHTEFSAVANRDRAGFPATSVMCQRCGLIFITPRMGAEAYSEFYGSGLYRSIVSALQEITDEQRHTRMVDSQAHYAGVVAGAFADELEARRGGTLLDIGGSTGVVAETICQRFDLRGTVLDPASSEVAEAMARGLSCVTGSIETWDTDETFDVIGIFQSIDHFLDIAGALRKVRRLLKPDGLFIVDLVEIRTLLYHCGPELATKIDHPFGLSEWTMRAFLMRAGFNIQRAVRTKDWRKVFFVCSAGDVMPDALPPVESVDEVRGLCGKRP